MIESIYLSVIIPSFNSAESLDRNLPFLIGYLKNQTYSYEIIIIDDGSNDRSVTERVCIKYHCIFGMNKRNMGKGAAIRKGMKMAKGKFKIFTDADIPYDLETIGTVLHYLDNKEFDLVIGDRNLKESSYFYEIPRLRRFTSAFFTYFVGTIVTTNFFDTQCGIKGFRAEIADFIFNRSRINGFSFDVEILYIALKRNFDIKRIPVKLRNQEKSTVRVFRHGIVMFFDLFKIKVHNMKGHYR